MRVIANGPKDARIVIVGEAPGADEERVGMPFVGASGRLLDEMLQRNGIERSQCFVTNLMQTRPLGNDFGVFYDSHRRSMPKPELLEGVRRVHAEIRSIRPNVVLALGNEPLLALTNKRGITDWRGSILELENTIQWPGVISWVKPDEYKDSRERIKVIGTFHPASILRQYSNRAIAELDIRRVREESLTPVIDLPTFDFQIRPTYEAVMSFLDEAVASGKIAFDIETVGRRVRCLGIAVSPRRAMCIPFMTLSHYDVTPGSTSLFFLGNGSNEYGSYWPEDREYEILARIDELFRNPNVLKIAQNVPFDSTLLGREFGFWMNGFHLDTLHGHHVLYPELPKNLDFLCSAYTRVPHYSEHNAANDIEEWTYNCTDAAVSYEVADAVERELKDRKLWTFYKDHVERTMIALTRAQNRYIGIDPIVRARLKTEAEASLVQVQQKLSELVKSDFNPNSPKQCNDLLYGTLMMVPQLHRKTKAVTTDEKALVKLKGKYPQHASVLDLILDHRGLVKLIGGPLGSELISPTEIETTYNVSGTVNGRLSASQTLWKTGVNIQQTDKGPLRTMYVARPGMTFIKTDLKQAEAMVVAWESKNEPLIEKFLTPGFDIHRWNASANVYRIPPEAVTKAQRQIAKAGVHGGNYGLGAPTASEIFGIAVADAKLSIEGFRKGCAPYLQQWWAEIEREVTASRRLRSVFGRERIFMDRLDHELFRSAYAFKPQATVVDIINRVFHQSDTELKGIGWPLIQAHDEIVFEVKTERLNDAIAIVRRLYDIPLTFDGIDHPLTIPVEISTGPNWNDQTELEDA